MEPTKNETMEILLVEDEKFHQVMAKKFLDKGNFHYRLHIAVDGEEALDFLRRKSHHENAPRPDLVLLDLGLPKIAGIEVFNQVKRDPLLKQIPIIVLSGADRDQLPPGLATQSGGFCFTKWMEMKDFNALIKTVQAYREKFSKKTT